MNILYFTSGLTGVGRLIRGISIGNALQRLKFDSQYSIISSSKFGFLTDRIPHIKINVESAIQLSKQNYHNSQLYKVLSDINPDVLIIDLLWFPLYHFIEELSCKKLFLCRQVADSFFSIPAAAGVLSFNPSQYDEILKIEPFVSALEMKQIHPLVIRNRDEIYSRKQALERLRLSDGRKICCITYSGYPGDFERVKKDYSYLEEEYAVIYTSTYHNGIFPIADYFNAIDFLVCGAGYNAFWEAKFFNKQAVFVPIQARFESGAKRIEECLDYEFSKNGADQLVKMIKDI